MSDPSIPDWINAGAAAIGALAIVVGLFGANAKINESSRAARQIRRSEVAEELISLAFNVDDAFRDMRNPFDTVPKEKMNDRKYSFQRRYERLVKYNDLFKSLRDAQIRVRAIIGNSRVDDAVEMLFRARGEVAIAIEELAEMADEELNPEDRESRIGYRKTLFGSFSKRDTLGQMIIEAVEAIERELAPIARIE